MSIDLVIETISLEGKEVTVKEADWDFTFRFSEIDKEVNKRIQSDPNYNATFKFFCENIYPLLASCVVGDAPTAEEAYALPRPELDKWYLTFWKLNPDIVKEEYPETIEYEEVTFRDGETIKVYASHGLPSFVLKLHELENYAREHVIEDDPQGQMFQLLFYPKMAASCNGSTLPDSNEVRRWPRSEILKWMNASRRLNPQWYAEKGTKEEEVVQKQKEAKEKKVKKQ